MTTVLLSLHNAGFYPMTSMILSMGIFYGGIAQMIVGYMEWKKGNTFGTVAFSSYHGLFWLTLVGLIALPKMGFEPENATSMAAYLFMWGLFTLFLFIGTLKISKALQVVFASLVVLFWLLALDKITGSEAVARLAGFEGIFCGASAIYAGVAQILNEVYGRVVLPLGESRSNPALPAAKKRLEGAFCFKHKLLILLIFLLNSNLHPCAHRQSQALRR